MLMWKDAVKVQSILKMRKTYLALESNFDAKDVLLNITAGCLSRIITCTKSVSVRKGEQGRFIGYAG